MYTSLGAWCALGALAAMALMTGCAAAPRSVPPIDRPAPELRRDTRNHAKPITVWFDATANWERLMTREGVAAMMDKCVAAGVDAVVIDVKPISGHVLHNSRLAPKLLEWKGVPHVDPDYDLLAVAIDEGRRRGLKVLASLNIFAEGHIGSDEAGVARHGNLLDDPRMADWVSIDYVVPQGATAPAFVPATQGVRGHAMFVSAANREAVAYQMALLREVAAYPGLDGICLDRCRWSGATADFSPAARAGFEAWLGHPVANWPEDILRWVREDATDDQPIGDEAERTARGVEARFAMERGPLWQRWIVWRAQVIHDLIIEARNVILGTNPDLVFANYTGAWYASYYGEGLNWASPRYNPADDYDWALPEYQQTAFAHLLDHLYHGWYYTDVTEEQARANNRPAWASMEGTARLVDDIILGDVPVHGGLYLFQYQGNPELFRQCMRAAYDGSQGLMLFDLIYLEDYDWWDEIPRTFPERKQP
ncbi:MAG: family 10 glycosylhydrolase [Candidatus Sumerlaeia bacterium]|nr:family 10 glycosylhydrolase [Candidatus Sumerlaeia bacterium]